MTHIIYTYIDIYVYLFSYIDLFVYINIDSYLQRLYDFDVLHLKWFGLCVPVSFRMFAPKRLIRAGAMFPNNSMGGGTTCNIYILYVVPGDVM